MYELNGRLQQVRLKNCVAQKKECTEQFKKKWITFNHDQNFESNLLSHYCSFSKRFSYSIITNRRL